MQEVTIYFKNNEVIKFITPIDNLGELATILYEKYPENLGFSFKNLNEEISNDKIKTPRNMERHTRI